MKTLGQIGYEAYCAETGWKSLVSGAQLPQWDDVKPTIKTAWESVGCQVRLHALYGPRPDWPDCGQVQCQQVHNVMESILDLLSIEYNKSTYAVGKACMIADGIVKLQKCRELLREYVNFDVNDDAAPLLGTLPQRAKESL